MKRRSPSIQSQLSRKQPSARPATNVASALFTSTQQRVLALLFGQPSRSYFTTEIIGLAGAGTGAVQRELRRLEEAGLVTVRSVGNQKHYQANPAAAIFEELAGIARKILDPASAIRKALAPLDHHLKLALVYGSVARRDDRAESDMDVLLVSDDLTLEQVYAALTPAEAELGRPVHPTLYTSREFRERRKRGSPFLERVLSGQHISLKSDDVDIRAVR